MSRTSDLAYAAGNQQALAAFDLKKYAGLFGRAMGAVGKALKWGGRVAGSAPGVGTAANVVLGGGGGLVEGISNQGFNAKGLAEGVARAGTNVATGTIPGGGGIAAGVAGDMAMSKLFPKKVPAGNQPQSLPGMYGSGAHLPGMAV